MAELYLSVKALKSIYYNSKTRRIITNQRCLYIDENKEALKKEKEFIFNDENESPNVIQELYKDGSIEIVAARCVCDKIRDESFSIDDAGASPVFIIDVDTDKAKKIQDNYGIMCMSDDEPIDLSILTAHKCRTLIAENKYFQTGVRKRNKERSWATILKRTSRLCNAIVFNDHYFFKNDQGTSKKNKEETRFYNLKEIFDSLLPDKIKDNIFQVFFLCEQYDFDEYVKHSTKIKETIQELRPNYRIDFQIVSGSNSCPLFKYTHNRIIATNYFIISAEHTLAAFNNNGTISKDQDVKCLGLYGAGIADGDDDDCPEIKHEIFLERISNIIEAAKVNPTSGYQYKENGNDYNVDIQNPGFMNRLVKQFICLRDGDNCSYLSVPYKSNWQELKIMDNGVYSRVNYKDCIVVPSKESNDLKKVIPLIKKVFENSASVEGENRDDKMKYYWVACSTASDIKTIMVMDPDKEIASNYYQFNCYQNHQDAEEVVEKVKSILKNNNLW